MRRQHLNFAPNSWARLWDETGPAARLLAAAGIALCLAAGWGVQQRLARIDDAESTLDQARHEWEARTRRPNGEAEAPLSEEQAAAVNAAIRQLDLPWRDLFDAIEAGTPAEIGLLSLEPDSRRAVIRIEAEADSSDAMLNYVETLKRQPFLTSVFLMKHAVDEKAGNHPLRFEIEAAWRSGPP